jgi:proline racemase
MNIGFRAVTDVVDEPDFGLDVVGVESLTVEVDFGGGFILLVDIMNLVFRRKEAGDRQQERSDESEDEGAFLQRRSPSRKFPSREG